MRNNRDRVLGTKKKPGIEDGSSVAAAAHQSNTEQAQMTSNKQSFDFPAPTELVRLPSGGEYYPPEHPLHNVETIEIRFMTAKDEDILTNKTFIKENLVVDKLLQSLIVDKRIDPKTLLSGDRNAILLASRVSAFGSDYKVKITCPSCYKQGEQVFDLSLIEHKEQCDLEQEEILLTDENHFEITLPRTKAKFKFKLLTGQDDFDILDTISKREKKGYPRNATVTGLDFMTVSVNGSNSRSNIYPFLENLPTYDARFIREVYSKVSPDIEMRQTFSCPNCNHEQEVDIPITVDFFWS